MYYFLRPRDIEIKSYKVFFFREFQLMVSTFDGSFLYHQIKTPINFWCRRGLNPRSVIQPSETLPFELTETHKLNPIKLLCKTLYLNYAI